MKKHVREFNRFVDLIGGDTKAATALGCSTTLIGMLRREERALQPAHAAKIERLYPGEIRKEDLIDWGQSRVIKKRK